jgi:glycosyltransferase involved in cell wall biosynthesis
MKKTIGIFHYQVGGTDGVSLEIEKWKQVLEGMGHTVHLCAGHLGTTDGTLIPEMYHHLPEIERLTYNTFTKLEDYDAASYQNELNCWIEILEKRFKNFFLEKRIDFIIPQNVWSVAANPPVAIALERVRQEFGIPALAHNHDFYFERPNAALTCPPAIELADCYLPPRASRIKHVVINSLAQKALLERKGIQAQVVPNVFDFESPPWIVDDYNRDFRQNIGLTENDLLILQATRIVTRKCIELAIDFVNALNTPQRRAHLQAGGLYDGRSFNEDSRIVLVMAGYARDDATGRYKDLLADKARRQGVETLFIEDWVAERRKTSNGRKVYSLWDTYVFADFVTYPSLWEGWGNQLLEAIRARLPILLFEYPVFRADIKKQGLKAISLGSQVAGQDQHGLVTIRPEMIELAADQAVELLIDSELRAKTVEHNFQISQRYYSMEALDQYIRDLMESFG